MPDFVDMPTRRAQAWTGRRWAIAALVTAVTIVVVGVPTDLIGTPFFGREIPPTWWAWPALIATAVLAGLLVATYVRSPLQAERKDGARRFGTFGSLLGFFAVGCPVCNKIVLLALGTSGAIKFFEPIQPLLAIASIGLLVWALVTRIRRENSCPVTTSATISA
ncbi:MAG: hypothetical protein ABI382_10195 [Nakamurella sp.]